MKIATPDYGERTVFMSYSINGKEYYLYVPCESYEGLLSVSADCCVVTDPVKRNSVIVTSEDGSEYSVHLALQDKDLLARVIDHDPYASEVFRRSLQEFGDTI